MGKCSVFTLSLCRQTDRWMDGQRLNKMPPDLLIQGHEKKKKKNQ